MNQSSKPSSANPSPRRGQSMGYWLSEPSIRRPERFEAAMNELADAGYAIVRVVLRNTNFTHRSPEVVAAIARAAETCRKRGVHLVLDCEPHSRPVAGDMGRQFPESMGARLVRAQTTLLHGQFRVVVPAPHTEAQMPTWEGIECAFVQHGGQVTRLDGLEVSLDWEIETFREGDTRLRQDYSEGKPVSERRICRLRGTVPGHSDGTLILYARFADTAQVDFWSPGLRDYYHDLLERYRGVPLAGAGWDEPAIGGDWNSYRYGIAFAKAFEERCGYALADRAYLLDAPQTTPDAMRVRLDYYETLNEGVVQAQAAFVAHTRDLFGENALLGTHHTWQGEGGGNDYRAGAVDYFRLADTQDAGYADCWWWDSESVCYAYVLASSLGRLMPSGQAEVNSWHAKPTNGQVDFQARLMSLYNLTWFNLWFGDNADTCQYPAHYTWGRTKSAMRRHDDVQKALDGLRPAVEIAVWHGWESIAGLNSVEMANAHKTCVLNLSKLLTDRSVPFDFIDSRVLASGEVSGDALETPLGRYRVLVLPYAAVIPEAAWAVCQQFAASGGRIVFTGPPPSLTTDGRDISGEFAALIGFKQRLPLNDYVQALTVRYTLPQHRADFLDCTVALDACTDSVILSAEDEPSAAANSAGSVVYQTDLDPRERLLDRITPWLNPEVECYSDSILWRLYQAADRKVLVLIAREGRRMQGIVRWGGHHLQITDGTCALVEIAGDQLSVTGDDVLWTKLPSESSAFNK